MNAPPPHPGAPPAQRTGPLPTLAALCTTSLAAHVAYLDDVGPVEDQFLARILKNASPADLARVADATLGRSGRRGLTLPVVPTFKLNLSRFVEYRH